MIEKVLFFICVSNLNIEIRRKFKLGVCACVCMYACVYAYIFDSEPCYTNH
nr:hypothetical protein GACBDANE_00074 [Spodoptera litura nucleopolyhedrovirus]